ncbi:hypothetical protein LEP1GSC077_1126 [Leptospira interrogans str. C10069]|nr:hypothetical protein LEP1GSC077_1126 [Leptospira interrogans str. C10069]EMN61512.1 hypothetical protein LEP1GSC092_2296 [Leptospira interrogans serovar Pyrogenes str. R168]
MDDDSFLYFLNSSHNSQSLTGKSTICESSHKPRFYEQILKL